jgi:hypothetical protein
MVPKDQKAESLSPGSGLSTLKGRNSTRSPDSQHELCLLFWIRARDNAATSQGALPVKSHERFVESLSPQTSHLYAEKSER